MNEPSATPLSAPPRSEDFSPAERSGPVQALARPSLSYWKDAWIRLKKNRQALVSLWVIGLLLAFTVFGPLFWPVGPSQQVLNRIDEPPSLAHSFKVLPPPGPFREEVAPGVDPSPKADGATLPAPEKLEIQDQPSVQGVRLRWTAVTGAAGYIVYRSTDAPGGGYLGLPVGDVDAGNVVTFEDAFNLKAATYHYSVVAKNGGSVSTQAATVQVKLEPGVSLTDAQTIRPGATPGELVAYPVRPFGTDRLGRDMLARLMAGARISLFIGLFAPLASVLIGLLLGGIAGIMGGRPEQWIMRLTDFVLGLPFLLFMILFKVAMGKGPGESGIVPMLVAWIALAWPGTARLTRGQVLQLREAEFVQASRLLGARPTYLLLRHLLPNTLGVLLVSLTFAIPSAIFTEAFLSFIGMGVVPPTPSWGSMCNDGIQTFLSYPHEFLFPAFFIAMAVLAFNLLGDGLRDALDPRLRSSP